MASEYAIGEYILVLDGRVLEIFHRLVLESRRFHVAFLAVEAKPHRDGYRVRLGNSTGDGSMINGGITVKVDAAEFERLRAFIALATAARDNPPA